MTEKHTTHIIIRSTPRLKRVCKRAAGRAGLSLADWCRGVLAMAANQGAFGPPTGGKKDGRKRNR
jgi:predicted HicB family RNase H-like nuclease